LNEQEYIEDLRRHAAESRALLSNSQKPERERMVVRAFLRCVGVPFSDDEIQVGTEEPVDVTFRSARFQVMGILRGRQPGKNWLEREKRYQAAKHISGLLEPWTPSSPMTYCEIGQQVARSLAGKASHYGVENCSSLDILVYVDLNDRHLWPLDATIDSGTADELARQGWCSVAMLFLPYGVVLAATLHAPQWLQEKAGRILHEWPHPDGWFDT
jgi:hypothetical protein